MRRKPKTRPYQRNIRLPAKNGRLPQLRRLFNQHNYSYRDKCLAMVDAAEHGQLETLQFLVSKRADIHFRQEDALQEACQNNHRDIVLFLIEKGAYVNANNGQALKNAARSHNEDMMELLIDHGAEFADFPKDLKQTCQTFVDTLNSARKKEKTRQNTLNINQRQQSLRRFLRHKK